MPASRRSSAIFLLLILFTTPVVAAAQAADTVAETERLRVGLVLGGGGARGATHVGVLRELERMRVPIDAIAGTSMGAFIGGLYATGMSADELEAILASTDWGAMMTDEPVRDDLDFRRKQDDAEFPIALEVGLSRDGIRMPLGLLRGHRLDLLLNELTVNAARIRDFDALPIPFRAVASDLERAEPFVIGEGRLADAIRASMSVPGILAPARVDGRLLADGGLFANVPVSAMRDMDVDVIIAVSAEFPLYAAEELGSAVRISEQMLTILIREQTRRELAKLGDEDILLQPDLGTFGSSDFAKMLDTIDPGMDAARAAEGRLRELALDEASWAAYRAKRQQLAEMDRERLAFIRIEHAGLLSRAALEARIRSRVGDPIDPSLLAADADRIYGLDLYDDVGYRLVEEASGTGVVFEAQVKNWGQNDLEFALALVDDFEGLTSFNVTARLTRLGINRAGAEWRSDLTLGTEPGLFSELYQPLGAGSRWFVAPRAEISRSNVGLFTGNRQIERLRLGSAEARFDIGREFRNAAELRLGVFRGFGTVRVRIGEAAAASTDFDSGGLYARFAVDTLDDAYFPTRGSRGEVSWRGSREAFGSEADLDAYSFDLQTNWSRGRSTTQLGFHLATTNGDPAGLQDLFRLGGFQRLSGLERDELAGPHAAFVRVMVRRRLREAADTVFDVPTYVGASLEAGNVWASRSDIGLDSTLIHGSIFGGLDTYLGPLFLAAGFGEGGQRSYYLFIGAPPR